MVMVVVMVVVHGYCPGAQFNETGHYATTTRRCIVERAKQTNEKHLHVLVELSYVPSVCV